MILGGSNADVCSRFARQFADQKHQAADTLCKGPVGTTNLNDALINLAQQHAGVDHFRSERIEQFISRHESAQGLVRELSDCVVDNAKLRAQLTAGPGRIDLSKAVLPEPTAYRKQ